MNTIHGIVFDFGGVISAPQDATFFQTMERDYQWTREEILAGWKKHRYLLDRGDITCPDLYKRMAADLGRTYTEAQYDALGLLDYDSWAHGNPETLAWAKELKAQGYKIGILTNMPPDYMPWFDRAAGEFRTLADAEVVSGDEHLIKPFEPIYTLMAQRMGLPPAQLLFLDDTLINVDAAKSFGWHAAQFTGVASGKAALAAYEA